MILPLALLQTWHQLEFNLGSPEDIEKFPWSAPVAVLLILGIGFFLWKARRNYMALPELRPGVAADASQVTVVIPARNEEENIGRCAGSLRGSPVVVVDDGSTDRTAPAARAAGATVIAAPPLEPGTMGKVNAMIAGEKLASTSHVLFADADTWFEPGFAGALLAVAEREKTVLVSAFLRQHCGSFFEHMLIPYAFALYFTGVNTRRVHDPLSGEVLANGQCMLFLRSAYEFFGGHSVVKDSVVEDVAIAQKVKRHRMKLLLMRAEKLGSVRMYTSLGGIWRGFQKNSFRFLQLNPRVGFQVVTASILLASVGPVAVWLAIEEQWPLLGILLLTPVSFLAPWYGSLGKAVLSLPAIYLFQLIALHGMVTSLLHRKTRWKGRLV